MIRRYRSLSNFSSSLSPRSSLKKLAAGVVTLGWLGMVNLGWGQARWSSTASTGNWSTAANWTDLVTSAPSYDISAGSIALQFANTGNATLTNDFAAGYAVGNITFNSGASSFVLTGNSINLIGGHVTTNSSSVAQTIAMDITLNNSGAADRSISNSAGAALLFTGNISGAGKLYITSGNVTFEGVISAQGVRRTNGGTLKLANANNSFADNVQAAAGILSVNSISNAGVNSAIGRGSVINLGQSWAQSVSVATLQLTNEYAHLAASNALYGTAGSGSTNRSINISNGTAVARSGSLASIGNWGGGIIENAVAGQTATFNGNVTTNDRNKASSLGLQGVGNGVLNGAIVNQAKMNVTKAGTGTWTLNAANTHAGTTTVSAGTLVIGNRQALGSTGFTTAGSVGGTVVGANAASTATLDLNGQTNVNEVITLNGTGVGGAGALVNNSTTAASVGNGIASITVSSSSGNVGGALPTVTITGGGGSGATAVATLGVTAASFTVTGGGTNQVAGTTNNYSDLTIGGGGGGGASAKVVIDTATNTVTGVQILSMGSGFTSAPTITVSTPGAGGGTAPTITTNNNNFAAEVSVTNGGSGYTSAPTVTLSGPGNNTAVANLSSVNLATASSIGGTGDLDILAVVSSATATAHLTKVGAGKVTLSADNTYTSNTLVNAGTLLAKNTTGSATGSGSVTTLTGSNATLGGNGTLLGGVGKNIKVSTGTFLMVGDTHGVNGGGAQLLTIGDSLAATNVDVDLNGTLQFDLFANDGASTSNPIGENDVLRIFSSATIDLADSALSISATGLATTSWAVGDTWKLIDWSGVTHATPYTGTAALAGAMPTLAAGQVWTTFTDTSGLYLSIAAVPEPGRACLFILALLGVGLRRRRL